MSLFGTIQQSAGALQVAQIGLQVVGCSDTGDTAEVARRALQRMAIVAEVEDAVWAFHAADTARDAEAVIQLLWPEFEMLGDGQRVSLHQIWSLGLKSCWTDKLL